MQIGRLGLPRIDLDDPPGFPRGDVIHLILVLQKAVLASSAGKEITERLASDSRVSELRGRLVGAGTGRQQFALNDLAAWWLWRANDVGREVADGDLERYLSRDSIETLQALWVYGIKVGDTTEVIPGINLVPAQKMPISMEREQFMGSKLAFPPSPVRMPQAALVTRVTIPKASSDLPSNKMDALWRAQADLRDVCFIVNCIGKTKCFGAFSTSYCPPDVPLGFLGGSGGGSSRYDVLPIGSEKFEPSGIGLEARLLDAFRAYPEKPKLRLSNAIRRLAQAKSRLNHSEFALDLGIALEMLLLGDTHMGGLPGQLHIQFRLRGSWLIGIDGKDRKSVYEILGRVYTTRSEVAHSGVSRTLDKLADHDRGALLDSYLTVAERIFVRLIENGFPENWDDLLLGVTQSSG